MPDAPRLRASAELEGTLAAAGEGEPPMSTTAPRRHPRHRALAELDRLIGRAEAARARSLADVTARGRAIRGLVEERLATLRRSRAALLDDEAR